MVHRFRWATASVPRRKAGTALHGLRLRVPRSRSALAHQVEGPHSAGIWPARFGDGRVVAHGPPAYPPRYGLVGSASGQMVRRGTGRRDTPDRVCKREAVAQDGRGKPEAVLLVAGRRGTPGTKAQLIGAAKQRLTD